MTITLKNVPREVHRYLQARAKRHRRSLNQEALNCLENTQKTDPERRRELMVEIDKIRERLAARGMKPMTQKQLRAAINEGRE